MDFPQPKPPAADAESLFERIWEIRDDLVRRVWGDFAEVYVQRAAAEAGPYIYVSEIAPAAQATPAARWTYVTGGLALPWTADLSEINPDDYTATVDAVPITGQPAADSAAEVWSGAGCEIVLHTPERAPWAVPLLHNLGQYVLTSGDGFAPGHRIPLGGPIVRDSDSALQVLLFVPPADRAPRFRLPSGLGQWLVALGITLDEWAYAQQDGSAALLRALRHAGLADRTDPARRSVFDAPDLIHEDREAHGKAG